MARGGELVAVDRDVVLRAAADGERSRIEIELIADVQHLALDDDEASGVGRLRQGGPAGDRGPEDEALLRQVQVATGRSDDAPDEEIEQHDERDLQDEQDGLVGGARDDHSRSSVKPMSVSPTVNESPGSSFARLTRRPFTSIPFVESRSTIQYAVPSWRSSA